MNYQPMPSEIRMRFFDMIEDLGTAVLYELECWLGTDDITEFMIHFDQMYGTEWSKFEEDAEESS